MKTLPELLGHLQLDRLLSADGPLLDGILFAGADALPGVGGRPADVVQRVKRPSDATADDDVPQPDRYPVHRAKSTWMSMMGRPVRTITKRLITVHRTPARTHSSGGGEGVRAHRVFS